MRFTIHGKSGRRRPTNLTFAAVQPVLEARSMPVRVARSPQPSYHAEDEDELNTEDEDHLCYPLEPNLTCETCELSDEWTDSVPKGTRMGWSWLGNPNGAQLPGPSTSYQLRS